MPGPFLAVVVQGQSRTGGRGWQGCVGGLGCRKWLLKRQQICRRSVVGLAMVQAGFFHESWTDAVMA